MLTHQTLDMLAELGLHGMAKAFRDLAGNSEAGALGHAEWLDILLEHESTLRHQKRFDSRAKNAKLRNLAAAEDFEYRKPRGLDRAMFLKLARLTRRIGDLDQVVSTRLLTPVQPRFCKSRLDAGR